MTFATHEGNKGIRTVSTEGGAGKALMVDGRGTKHRAYLEQNIRALDVVLNELQRERLETAFFPGVTAGSRYPEKQMATLGI